VRLVYLDEAGISNSREEPILVVAGIIVHGDDQWKNLEQEILSLRDEYIPEQFREGFVFHATELFSGGKFFNRESWPKQMRWEILLRLLKIINDHKLPVVVGHVDRATFNPQMPEGAKVSIETVAHTAAFTGCAIQVEHWMRTHADSEVAMLIAEDRDRVKKMIKMAQTELKKNVSPLTEELFSMTPYLPLTKIVDTVHFAGKTESSLLQLADACAFVLKRSLANKPDASVFTPLLVEPVLQWARGVDLKAVFPFGPGTPMPSVSTEPSS
jgi:hypothetical protein